MTETPKSNDRFTCGALFAACAALLVYGSLVPFRFCSIPPSQALQEFTALFHLPVGSWGETADWSVNVTIMIPIAFFAIGAIVDGRSRWLAWWSAPVVVLTCVAISLTVEFAQVWCEGRVASSRDVVAQTLGACIGVAIWLIVGERFSIWRRSFTERRQSQHKLEWFLQAYSIGLAIYSLVPVNLVMSPTELARKYRSGLIELLPFTYYHGGLFSTLYSTAADILLFIPVGMCVASAWNRRGRELRPALQALWFGLLYIVGLETAQLFVVGRYTSSTDVILGFSGVVVGVYLIHFWRRKHLTTDVEPMPEAQAVVLWLFAALVYLALLAAIFWTPYRFTNDIELVKSRLDAFFEIPFVRMQEGSDVTGIFAAIRKVLWFAPLGVIFGMVVFRSPVRRRHVLVFLGVTTIFAIALAMELGQVLLPDRVADSTDVLIMASGGIAGLWATIVVAR